MVDAVVVYSTRSGSTGRMAKAVAEGLVEGGLDVKVYDLRRSIFEDFKEELEKAKAVVVGTPTHDYMPAYEVNVLLSKMEELNVKGKIGAVFGSYGWSGEAVYEVQRRMRSLGFNVVTDPLRIIEDPDEDGLRRCRELGLAIAGKVKGEAS
ncbi:MAG: flavodoxin domain-containing protein [Candidatus Jordarchaeales archaeon]|nr:FprA family A-type flavoprotein [Candidatus Jordarchaeia archaeon]